MRKLEENEAFVINNISFKNKNKKIYGRISRNITTSSFTNFLFLNSYDGVNWSLQTSIDLDDDLEFLKEIKINQRNNTLQFVGLFNNKKQKAYISKNSYDNYSIILSLIEDNDEKVWHLSYSSSVKNFDSIKFF
jgi:hypothetical protein